MSFPLKLEDEINGPVESIFILLSYMVGLCVGWMIGVNCIEFVHDNFNSVFRTTVLEYLIKTEPFMFKVIFALFVGRLFFKIFRIIGILVDKLIGTYSE